MIATADNWKDVRKYYEHTYILVPEYDEEQAVYVDVVTPEGIKVKTESGEKGFLETPYNIVNPLTLRREWFQCGDRALLVQRIPARMWRKGISSENTAFSAISAIGGLANVNGGWGVVNGFFRPKAYVEQLTKNSPPTCALNNKWAVKNVAGGPLFLFNSVVGRVSVAKKTAHILKEVKSVKLPVALQDWKTIYV